MKISCGECAAACCRLEVPCIGDHDIPDRLFETDTAGNRRMRRLDDGWCAAVDRAEMNCGIYAQRPLPCRELALGGAECLAARERLADHSGPMV
jgi:Fe-S-cluster containining protein